MTPPSEVVFLFDVDNTLLDNDRIVADLGDHLAYEFGDESRDRYWEIFEALSVELGYADYLGALQRYRVGAMNDPRLLMMSSFLVDYPFAERLYPGALDPRNIAAYSPADITIKRIGGLINYDFPALLGTPKAGCAQQEAS